MTPTFRTQLRIELFHVDGAGIIFYAHLFSLAHVAFADFLRKNGYGIKERLDQKDFLFPVVSAKADYIKPLMLDDVVDITVSVMRVGNKSFQMSFEFYKDQELFASSEITHAYLDGSSYKSTEINEAFRAFLESHLVAALN